MKISLTSHARVIALGAFTCLMAACTTQSGPTYSAYSIQRSQQPNQAYRVTCGGLFESTSTCSAVAARICHDANTVQIENVDGLHAEKATRNPREIIFTCRSPAAEESTLTPPPVVLPLANPQSLSQPSSLSTQQTLLQGDANFTTDSAVLMPTAKVRLDQFLRANQNASFQRITIIGYTDSTGTPLHNQNLSEARAASAMQYLREHGLRANEYIAEGRGSQDAVASNSTAKGRVKNRRVEVQILTTQSVEVQ
jgi:outer membrane protein OmpA-like peptidoglycan-associated protein